MDTLGPRSPGQPTPMVDVRRAFALVRRDKVVLFPVPDKSADPLPPLLKVALVTRSDMLLRSQPTDNEIQDTL